MSQYAPPSRPAAHAARRPDERDKRQTDVKRQTDRQTDVRQHHRLMPPGRGHNKTVFHNTIPDLQDQDRYCMVLDQSCSKTDGLRPHH